MYFRMLIYHIFFLILFLSCCLVEKIKLENNVHCDKWLSKVDPSVMYSEKNDEVYKKSNNNNKVTIISTKPKFDDTLDDYQVLEAIECLLKCEGKKNKAKISGVTNLATSQILPEASIELAALYYISYLYWKKWDHADGIAIRNRNGEINPEGSIKKAYKAYRTWYNILKINGIKYAIDLELNPLEGVDLFWYGN